MPTKHFPAGNSLLDSTANKGPRHLSSKSRENGLQTRPEFLEVHARFVMTLEEDNQRIVFYLGKNWEGLLGAEFVSGDIRSAPERSQRCTTQNKRFLKKKQACEVRAASLKQDSYDPHVPRAIRAN